MRSLLLASVSIAALFIASEVNAADLAVKARPMAVPAPVYSWTGCYVGGSMGSDWAKSSWTYRNINPYSALSAAGPIVATDNRFDDMLSWIAGGQVGCNYEFQGHWVVGIEAAGFASDLNQTIQNSVQIFSPLSTQTVTTNIKAIYTVTGRLGYAFYPGWLGYAKGGFASARIETSGNTNPTLPGLILDWNTRQWHDGYVVGVGSEYQLSRNITLGLEYDYIGLGSKDHVGAVSGGAITAANQIVHGVNGNNIQSVMVRVNYLFGMGR